VEDRLDRVKASLRGTLAGDSLGLVYEGLSPAKVGRIAGDGLTQRFFFGRGVPSDDSAHAYFTALALYSANGDPATFEKCLRRWIRNWFLALPFGIGLATLKSGIKMTLVARNTSVNSAGNGPAMRAAVIGSWFQDDPAQIEEFVRRSTRLTHSHPLALAGSLALSNLAAGRDTGLPSDWPEARGDARKGPSGFIVHTVNTAIDIIAEAKGDPLKGIELAVRRGGDTDTIAAIVGGIIGLPSVPCEAADIVGWPSWSDIDDFPRAPSYFRILRFHLACYPVVLYHGIRRLF